MRKVQGMPGKVHDKVDHLKLRVKNLQGSREREQQSSPRSSPSFVQSADHPRKVGRLEYRINAFWHKAFFKLHGHFLTFSSSDSDKEGQGSLNLWNVQDIVLDDNEIRIRFNENALDRHRPKLHLPKKGDPIFRLRAGNAEEAQEWIEAMKSSSVVEQAPHGKVNQAQLATWNVKTIKLQESSGAVLNAINHLGNVNAKVLLGKAIRVGTEVEMVVTVEGPGHETLQGSQRLHPEDSHGQIVISMPRPQGEPLEVNIAWQSESVEAGEASLGDLALKPESLAVLAGSLVALLISAYLFLVVAGGGGYWVFTHRPQSEGKVELYITDVNCATIGTERNVPLSARGPATPTSSTEGDQSISVRELGKLAELRAMLQDLRDPGSGVPPDVFEKHVNVDYRLVRFLRARPTIPAAADMVRESLRWRTETGAETIMDTFKPMKWIWDYFGTPSFVDCLKEGKDRVPCYHRDKKGHLTVYWRGGFVDWKTAFNSIHANIDYGERVLIWLFEMLRQDLDKVHEQTNGAIPSYIVLVYDLEGFEFNKQVAISTMLPIVQRFFYILNINYPELIYRVVIVRAPWLFSSIWSVMKPLIPPDLLNKITLTGGGKLSKVVEHITPVMDPSQIPKFLGGTLTDPGGDGECTYSIGPRGPFLPDKGHAFLNEGLANPPPLTSASSSAHR